MKDQISQKLPILTINEVNPILRKDEKVYANVIRATTEKGDVLFLYGQNAVNFNDYIGQKMECLLEIVRGKFEYKSKTTGIPKNTLLLKYDWLKRPYELFPELVKSREYLPEEAYNEDALDQAFEKAATQYFEEWGLTGLQIGIFQAKPLFNSELGSFLLNEYQFEEEIEELELGEEVYIKVQEIYLRGIRPVLSPTQEYKKQTIIQPISKEEPVLEPKPEIKEAKKRRIFFQ